MGHKRIFPILPLHTHTHIWAHIDTHTVKRLPQKHVTFLFINTEGYLIGTHLALGCVAARVGKG